MSHQFAVSSTYEGVVNKQTVSSLPAPQIRIELIASASSLLFEKLSDVSSNLWNSRDHYLTLLRKPPLQLDIAELEVAASRYEADIYSAINEEPPEGSAAAHITEFGIGYVTGAAFESLIRKQLTPLSDNEEMEWEDRPDFPRNKNIFDRLMTRRGFIAGILGAGLVAAWAETNRGISTLSKTVFRSAGVTIQDLLLNSRLRA